MRAILFITVLLYLPAQSSAGEVRARVLNDIKSRGADSLIVIGYRWPAERFLGASYFEVSGGLIRDTRVTRALASIGPVWEWDWELNSGIWTTEFSFAPTVLSGGKLDERDMGGVFHFTSGLGFGWSPSRENPWYVGLRWQHTSNGSLHRRNPGLDAFGIEVAWQR